MNINLFGNFGATMSGDEEHDAEANYGNIGPELLQLLFDKSLDSWFARHTPNTTAMASGTQNKAQTAQEFALMSCVVKCCEVRLLKWDKLRNIGVSPDDAALVKIPWNKHLNLGPPMNPNVHHFCAIMDTQTRNFLQKKHWTLLMLLQ